MMLHVTLLSMLMALPSILNVIRHLILWQQLELAPELKSDLQDTMDRGRKWFADFSAEKLNWFSLTGLITLVLLM